MMSLKGPSRVHIAPQGYEDERIFEPAINMDADKVILVAHNEATDRSDECREEVEKHLQENNIEIEIERCDFFELQGSLSTITDLIRENRDNTVRINISTGSKITAIAGMFACMIHDAMPYYVKVDEYPGEPISKNVVDSFKVPTYPIQLIDDDLIQVLQFLLESEEKGEEVNIKAVNEFAQEAGLSVIEDSERNDDQIYDIINPNIIEPLEERDYIEIQGRANKKLLKLTDRGKNALKLTQFALE